MKDIQCASMTFFKFNGILNQIWGMTLLLSLKFNFSKYDQFEFFKLLGAGSGLGYRAWPKFGVIGVFMIWKSAEGAKEFFESKTFKRIQETCKEQFTVLMQPTSSRGTWSGFGNWRILDNEKDPKGIVCALTRATIKKKYLIDFWKMVPTISKTQKDYRGLIFSQGVGEVPILEQTTFTIWESVQSMEEFAYNTFHGKAVQRVRQANGFKEQMFTRFKPIMTLGSWEGKNILAEYNVPEISTVNTAAEPVAITI